MERKGPLSTIGFAPDDAPAVPLVPLRPEGLDVWLDRQPSRVAAWLRRLDFRARAGTWQPVPAVDGDVAMIVAGVGDTPDLWSLAGLPRALPEGIDVRLEEGAGLDPAQVATAQPRDRAASDHDLGAREYAEPATTELDAGGLADGHDLDAPRATRNRSSRSWHREPPKRPAA